MPDEQSDAPPRLSANLKTWERWLSGVIGAAGVAVGGVGIFLSDNQAGTTAILLVGAVFILLAVQGTAARKVSKDALELSDREAERQVIDKVRDKLEDEGPDEARAVLEGATAARPQLVKNSSHIQYLSAEVYQGELYDAIGRVWKRVFNQTPLFRTDPDNRGADITVAPPDHPERKIAIKIAEGDGRGFSSTRAHKQLESLMNIKAPCLVTGRMAVPGGTVFVNTAWYGRPIEFTVWRGHEDDEQLGRSLKKLMQYYDDEDAKRDQA